MIFPVICNVSFSPVWPDLSLEYTTSSSLFDIFILFLLLLLDLCLALISDLPYLHYFTFDLGFNLSFSHCSINWLALFPMLLIGFFIIFDANMCWNQTSVPRFLIFHSKCLVSMIKSSLTVAFFVRLTLNLNTCKRPQMYKYVNNNNHLKTTSN